MSEHSSRTTTDHDQIREWAEARGATPSRVKGTGSGDDPGMIRLDFPGFSGEGSLEEISWEDWFQAFDDNDLALVYQEATASGERSNFNKLIARETADLRDQGESHASRHKSSDHSRSKSTGTSRRSETTAHASGDSSDLKNREYRDSDGNVHHHTHPYMDEHRGEHRRDEE